VICSNITDRGGQPYCRHFTFRCGRSLGFWGAGSLGFCGTVHTKRGNCWRTSVCSH